MDLQDEKEDWIREQLKDPNADELHPEWSYYENEFFDTKFSATTELDILWYSDQTNKSLFSKLKADLEQLKEVVAPGITATGFEALLYKMAYAHAVTLLETFLSDSVKSLILSNDIYFEKALKGVDELKKPDLKFPLLEVWRHPKGVKGIVLKILSEILYHNIPKVKTIIEVMVGYKLNIDIARVQEVTLIRHDIAHRNGKTQEGDELNIGADMVEDAIDVIERFAESVHSELDSLPF